MTIESNLDRVPMKKDGGAPESEPVIDINTPEGRKIDDLLEAEYNHPQQINLYTLDELKEQLKPENVKDVLEKDNITYTELLQENVDSRKAVLKELTDKLDIFKPRKDQLAASPSADQSLIKKYEVVLKELFFQIAEQRDVVKWLESQKLVAEAQSEKIPVVPPNPTLEAQVAAAQQEVSRPVREVIKDLENEVSNLNRHKKEDKLEALKALGNEINIAENIFNQLKAQKVTERDEYKRQLIDQEMEAQRRIIADKKHFASELRNDLGIKNNSFVTETKPEKRKGLLARLFGRK